MGESVSWLVLELDNLERGHRGLLSQSLHLTRMEKGVFGAPPFPAGSFSLKEEKHLMLKKTVGQRHSCKSSRLLRSCPGAKEERAASMSLSLGSCPTLGAVLGKQK